MNANSPISETSLTDQAVAWLKERMPRGWEVEGTNQASEGTGPPADARISLRGPNGTISTIVVEEKEVVSPRIVLSELSPRMQSARNLGAHLPLLVVTPWLSRRAQGLLADEEISYIDLTGNALLRIDNPPFYIQTAGAERNPWPKERGRAQLRGAKAARLIRLLIDVRPPYGLQEIAKATSLAPGYVSRLLDTLYREALIERAPRGPVERVDIAALLRRWAASYDVFQANDAQGFIATEGLERLLSRAAGDPAIGTRSTITGSFAAGRIAPVASPALLLIYYDAPALLARDLGLLPADEGADVMLLRPFDPVVFDRNQIEEGLRYAAPSQIAVDCLTGNGRMPAEGEALLDWMLENEAAWRLASLQALYTRGDR
jgi:IclR helix-turn-helix domain